MKASKGKANPAQVNEILKKKLGAGVWTTSFSWYVPRTRPLRS
jgi:hypothetical protein